MIEVNKIYCGDCLEVMRDMPEAVKVEYAQEKQFQEKNNE